MLDYQGHRPFRWPRGWPCGLPFRYSDAARQLRPALLSGYAGDAAARGSADCRRAVRADRCCERFCYRFPQSAAVHRDAGHADAGLRRLPCVYGRDSDWRPAQRLHGSGDGLCRYAHAEQPDDYRDFHRPVHVVLV